MNLFTYQKQTHRLREQAYGYQWERVGGIDGEFGIDMYTLLLSNRYPTSITSVLYSIGSSAQ